MSREARDWAWDHVADLTPGQGLVLLYVAERADRTGYCFPRPATITAATGLAHGSVTHRLLELDRAGYLTRERERRANGSFTGKCLIQLAMLPSGRHGQVACPADSTVTAT